MRKKLVLYLTRLFIDPKITSEIDKVATDELYLYLIETKNCKIKLPGNITIGSQLRYVKKKYPQYKDEVFGYFIDDNSKNSRKRPMIWHCIIYTSNGLMFVCNNIGENSNQLFQKPIDAIMESVSGLYPYIRKSSIDN